MMMSVKAKGINYDESGTVEESFHTLQESQNHDFFANCPKLHFTVQLLWTVFVTSLFVRRLHHATN